MSTGKKVAIAIGALVCALILVVGAYVAFVALSIYRVGDTPIEVEDSASYETVQTGTTYSISTFNYGFGAYSQDYSCIVDTGYVQDSSGNWVLASGERLKARDAEEVISNTEGATRTLKSLSADFVLTQEVDTASDRSRQVNQKEMIQDSFAGYASTFAVNNHTPFMAYPFSDMEGFVNSGLLTLSRYAIKSADRHELAMSDDLISLAYDLDRCFSASYVDVDSGKQLVLVNIHLSSFATENTIRDQQRKQLYDFINSEFAKNNYVIVGGDFNHDLLTNNPDFPQYTDDSPAFSTWFTEKIKDNSRWFNDNGSAELPIGFSLVASDNWPSYRNASVEWIPGFTQISTVDGFLVSNNIKVISHKNVETGTEDAEGFAYSDHEPAYMEFELM